MKGNHGWGDEQWSRSLRVFHRDLSRGIEFEPSIGTFDRDVQPEKSRRGSGQPEPRPQAENENGRDYFCQVRFLWRFSRSFLRRLCLLIFAFRRFFNEPIIMTC